MNLHDAIIKETRIMIAILAKKKQKRKTKEKVNTCDCSIVRILGRARDATNMRQKRTKRQKIRKTKKTKTNITQVSKRVCFDPTPARRKNACPFFSKEYWATEAGGSRYRMSLKNKSTPKGVVKSVV